MCGIFGCKLINKSEIVRARNALDTLTHRGPDQKGEWFSKDLFLGHRRLSILDLSENGKQPMKDDNEDVIITVNGEIYNYKQLKEELQLKYDFKSKSDSEIVIYGYKEWGTELLLRKIEGMFALVIYDKKKNRIILARDRVGIKPLYYSLINNQPTWSSELKAIEKFYNGNLVIDKTALFDFLTYLYVPTPKTLYKNVYKLPPAHYISYDLNTNRLTEKKYWGIKKINQRKVQKVKTLQQNLVDLIKASVNEQLMSDVPIGFFLSGGLDSSTVVGFASELIQKINTYSIGFDVKSHNELNFAKIVAERFNTNHTEKILSINKGAELFNRMKSWYDEPFADTSAIPTFLVSSIAKQTSTVVLTGDGGDEIFGGYTWYSAYLYQKETIPTSLKKFIKYIIQKNQVHKRLSHNEIIEIHTKSLGGLLDKEKTDYKKKFDIPDDYDSYWYFKKYYKPYLPVLTRLQYLDFHTYLPDDILTKVDRVSMAVSLEARVPLLSTKLIEYIFSIPEGFRYHHNSLKGLLKTTMQQKLPDEIISRQKKGFSIPQHVWKKELFANYETKQEAILNQFFLSNHESRFNK